MKSMKKLIFTIIVTFALMNFACSSKLTAETTGQITGVAIDRDTKTSKRKTSSNKRKKTTTSVETEIEYRYTVGGKSYDGYAEKDGDVQRSFQTGSSVVVCYNPSKPEESDVFTSGTKCGG
jgi:nucleoside-specific outer membrane channel protein Tsx